MTVELPLWRNETFGIGDKVELSKDPKVLGILPKIWNTDPESYVGRVGEVIGLPDVNLVNVTFSAVEGQTQRGRAKVLPIYALVLVERAPPPAPNKLSQKKIIDRLVVDVAELCRWQSDLYEAQAEKRQSDAEVRQAIAELREAVQELKSVTFGRAA